MKRLSILVLLLPLAACGAKSDLQKAYDTCFDNTEKLSATDQAMPAAGDVITWDKKSGVVSIETPQDADDGEILATSAVACMLRETHAPAGLSQKFGSASAMTGAMEGKYKGISATYSYDGTDDGDGVTATFEPAD